MSKNSLSSIVAHPNLSAARTKGLKGAYDVVIVKDEKFVTPDGKKGRTRIFARVSPEQIKDDKSGVLKAGAKKARFMIGQAIARLKAPTEKKQRMLDLMGAQIKGDIKNSSKEFFSADAFHTVNQSGFRIPVQKQVRFIDATTTEIPMKDRPAQALPKEVILPELPPDE